MEKTTWYLNCSKSNIAPYVILVGDPSRLSLFEENMTGARVVAHSREFKTLTGTYADVDISVISVGIGAPATAIAMEELWQLSVQAIVRSGTAMVTGKALGHFILPSGAIRYEGTSHSYLPREFPAVADHVLLESYCQSLKESGAKYEIGILASADGFYSQLFTNTRFDKTEPERPDTRILNDMKQYRVAGMDMETSLVYSLGHLLNIPVLSCLLASVDGSTRAQLEKAERTEKENQLVRLSLQGLADYAKRTSA